MCELGLNINDGFIQRGKVISVMQCCAFSLLELLSLGRLLDSLRWTDDFLNTESP